MKRHLAWVIAALVIIGSVWHVANGLHTQRRELRIVGSSTVFPFVAAAAEQFGLGGHATPIVEATGTGGGFKLFCSGVGERFPDINNASRPITASELDLCAKHGVNNPLGLAIGFDGIVLASAKNGISYALTKRDVFLALARAVPTADGQLQENPYKRWKDIRPALPDSPIDVYGPPPTSGTRDAFVELLMEKACSEFKAFETAYPDKDKRKKQCHMLREDGRFVEAGEDDNMIIQKLANNTSAIGIVGYSFYDENRAHIQAATIEGEVPSYDSIETGRYKVARSLYVYFKREHLAAKPDMAIFANELVSEASLGEDGYLTYKGLLPLPLDEREKNRQLAKSLGN